MQVHDRSGDPSSVITDGMSAFADARGCVAGGMRELVYFIGKKLYQGRVTKGRLLRFTARELARDVKLYDTPAKSRVTILYYTSDGKYLVISDYRNKETEYINFFVRKTVHEICRDSLPYALIRAAARNDMEMPIEEPDQGLPTAQLPEE